MWPPSKQLISDQTCLTFIPTTGGRLILDWLDSVSDGSDLLISMCRWDSNGNETAFKVVELANRVKRISVITYPKKIDPIIFKILREGGIEIYHSTKAVPRYMVELGEDVMRVLTLSLNFNGNREINHDFAYLTRRQEFVSKYMHHWHLVKEYCTLY
jgi:hypothetical protein